MTKDYPIFEHWYKTLDWIFKTVERFPKFAKYSIASRIINEAMETLDNIIEAIYNKNRIPFLDKINLSLEKQRVMFRISCDRKFISKKQYEYISRELNKAGKMAGGWRKSIQ